MKLRLILIFIAIEYILGCSQPKNNNTTQTATTIKSVKEPGKTSSEKVIETIKVDLNDDGKTDTITLTLPSDYGDPGAFNKVYVSLAGSSKKAFSSKADAWDKIHPDFAGKNVNEVKSDKVFVYKKPDITFILLFGYVFGSGSNEFTVMQVKNGVSSLIFDDAMDYPEGFTDTNHDGTLQFLGRPSLPEQSGHIDSLDADILTYDPYKVYDIYNGFKIDKDLTKKYNEENYVWAGLKSDEKIKVLVPRKDGKPKIIK